MRIPAISGHCTRGRALEYETLTLFTMGGRTYAVLGSWDGREWGLFLIVTDDEYEAWANYFCR